MKKSRPYSSMIMTMMVNLLLLADGSLGQARNQTVELICGTQTAHNETYATTNFIASMDNISEQVRTSGFGIASTGSGPDNNYALVQCYGDLSLVNCFLCFAEARSILPQCFPYNVARVFLDGCFMRAENRSFFQEYTGPGDRVVCGNTTRKNSAFQVSARSAVEEAVLAAPRSNGYARAQVPVSGTENESAYVLANCWRTLSDSSCRACLENASSSVMGCLPWSEGRALNTGCFLRYSDTNFLNPIPRSGISRGTRTVAVIAAIGSIGILVIGAIIAVYIWKDRVIVKKRKGLSDAEKLEKTLNDVSLIFKYSTLEKATGSFDEANKLGQGGFGTVYKGVLPDGREIAVKRLFLHRKHRAADLYNEVNIISSVEHKNLVRLLGCCCSGPESLLVYEFLPNKSLDFFIFDPSKGNELNWEQRFKIIKGIAEGLVYLHENTKNRIIHRDIKASNILLDAKLHAKIADFGLARYFQEDKSHISTAIVGTLGYMAPEYLAHGQLTEKADIYSFGVLLLEIISGRQNNMSKATEHSDSLLTLTWKHFKKAEVDEVFDPNIILHNHHTVDVKDEIRRVVHVGLWCTQEIPSLRPSISRALLMLVKKEEHLPAPTNPPFLDEKTMEINLLCENPSLNGDYGIQDSIASISQSIFYPR